MSEDEIYAAVKEVLVEELQLDGATIQPQANLQRDLGLDSLDIATVALALEERFGVDLPDDALHQLETIEQAVGVLATKINAGA
jgi:acyl carrier protein